MDADGLIKLGPAGESSGKLIDEKGRNQIAQYFVWHDEDEILGIQFQYVKNEDLVLGELHGGTSTWTFDSIQLNYPSEYITSISGCYNKYKRRITNLDIKTNKYGSNSCGPFGCPRDPYHSTSDGESFHFGLGNGCQYYGFCSTVVDDCLRSLGVYLKPARTLSALANKENENEEYIC